MNAFINIIVFNSNIEWNNITFVLKTPLLLDREREIYRERERGEREGREREREGER